MPDDLKLKKIVKEKWYTKKKNKNIFIYLIQVDIWKTRQLLCFDYRYNNYIYIYKINICTIFWIDVFKIFVSLSGKIKETVKIFL